MEEQEHQNEPQTTEYEVTTYLRAHPQFFEQHAHLLTELYLPSPHGQGTISLAERQQLAQRDRIRVLDARLAQWIKLGEENDAISDKVHRLSLGLLATEELVVMLALLEHSLREDFHVPYVSVRLWSAPRTAENSKLSVFATVDQEMQRWASSLSAPYCGHQPGMPLQGWFGTDARPVSYAAIPLKGEKVLGLLVLASDDEKRFRPEMDTVYLKRIGELVSAALLRHIAV
ncbi:hypothetical protein SAMN05192560_1081 [Methylobacillus rhizosphaerae]|uniref:GAF domain-containing protein n=1 Tax=Methylobacillus rhizosphaerae TaxID=551994 RepID=A0A238Z7A7_9PROT|nr:DUF484 family protein [Methylobacillus rhizosphaerae]SNR78888.1 hypothetical protein SAMN05192560_1081 [Methylobacillus rhizosphaerae]